MTSARQSSNRHTADRNSRRAGREIAAGLVAALALAAAVIGLPIALYIVAGVPLPHHAPSPGQLTHALTQRDNGQLFLSALLVVAWVSWAVFTLSVAAETAALLRGTAAIRIPGCAPTQQLAASLLAAVAVLFLAAPQAGEHQPTPRPLASSTSTLTSWEAPTRHSSPAARYDSRQPAPNGRHRDTPATPTYVVQRGDTLWSIAETHLGNPERWREIARLNYDRPQPDQRALTNSHWIYPGWRLQLPADATGVHATRQDSDTSTSAPATSQPSREPASPTPPTTTPEVSAATASAPSEAPSLPERAPVAGSTKHSASIVLTSGSELGGAFAAGVLVAMAALRQQRRRAYRPASPSPAPITTGEPPPAPLRTLLTANRSRDDDADTDEPHTETIPTTVAARPLLPDTIEVGTRDGMTVTLALLDWPQLVLSGPATDAVVRMWLASLLTQAGPYGVDIIGTTATLDRLHPSICRDLPSLRLVADSDAVLAHMEAEQLRRTRLLADAEVSDGAELRARHPEDPLPVTLAILDTPDPQRAARWDLISASAGRLGMSLVILDPRKQTPGGANIEVNAAADVIAAQPQPLHATLAGARLFTITGDEVVALLGSVAAAHRQPEERPSTDLTAPEPDGQVEADDVSTVVPVTVGELATQEGLPSPRWPTPRGPGSDAPLIVRAFGPITLQAWGRDIDIGLRESARELLVWYLLHPDGAPAETAIDVVWPDAPPGRGAQRFWNALGNLRSRLRGPRGQHLDVLTKIGDIYCPQPEALDVDLWRFQNALDQAARDDGSARDALTTAVDLYRGDLASTADYLWLEPVREELHRHALDAHVRLAELHDEAGETDAAINVLERAITLDPVAEDLYRRLIRLLGRAGRRDSVNRLWKQLQGKLADIDLDPEPVTVTLVRKLQDRAAAPSPLHPSRR
ncbi:MAG: BTAD domain-containing putative transcriptional regulator [Mycobacteriales bacterium]